MPLAPTAPLPNGEAHIAPRGGSRAEPTRVSPARATRARGGWLARFFAGRSGMRQSVDRTTSPHAKDRHNHGAAALSARRRREEARALRHTRLVKRLRLALPTISAVIVAGLMVAAIVPKLVPLSALAGLSLTADGLVMNEPRLAGSLGEGRRYEVVADRAVQSLLSPANLSLDGLHASLDLGTDGAVTIDGAKASYNTDTEILELSKGVQIASTDGNHATLNDATVFLKSGQMESDGGITISSPRGTITAGAINIIEGGAVIRLSGGVSITIHPEH